MVKIKKQKSQKDDIYKHIYEQSDYPFLIE